MREFYWVAGFLEGEGSFSFQRNQCRVQATQKQAEPLERVQRLLGGRIYLVNPRTRNGPIFSWQIYQGRIASGVMMTLYPLMSCRRREQICRALRSWQSVKPLGWKNKSKTHCPAGHAYDEANMVRTRKGSRVCRICRNAAYRRRWPKYAEKQRQRRRSRNGLGQNVHQLELA